VPDLAALPILDAFAPAFMQRALLGGLLVALLCAIAGTWVVVRGTAFLGEAMAHGMLPGVAIATIAGLNPVAGAAVSALAMAVGVGTLVRRGRVGHDAAIGVLFVGMLALGVVIVSAHRAFPVDLTAILFGDVLAIRAPQLLLLAVALVVAGAIALLLHRAFLALAFDERIAQTLRLRPRVAELALLALLAGAIVVSYQAVGSLLVVGMLVAPPVAAAVWARRVPTIMLGAALVGVVAVLVGLLASWHLGTAAGASIALAAAVLAVLSAAAGAVRRRVGARATVMRTVLDK
jgi:zinc/manganese transport system permease protein